MSKGSVISAESCPLVSILLNPSCTAATGPSEVQDLKSDVFAIDTQLVTNHSGAIEHKCVPICVLRHYPMPFSAKSVHIESSKIHFYDSLN